MLRGAGSVLSFLTIIPSPGADLERTARHMYLFPAVGVAIGLLAGSIGLGLSGLVDPLLVGLVVASSIAIVTGVHHADGLADFADGLMARGTRENRLRAMKDVATGSAGTVAIVLYMVGLIAAISLTGGYDLLVAVLVSEVLAKFAMVLVASLGRPATSGAAGSGTPFVHLMKDRRRLTAAAAITLVPVVLLGGATGLAMLAAALATTLLVLAVSTRSFGGVTGDVMGATNELARLASLLVFVTI